MKNKEEMARDFIQNSFNHEMVPERDSGTSGAEPKDERYA